MLFYRSPIIFSKIISYSDEITFESFCYHEPRQKSCSFCHFDNFHFRWLKIKHYLESNDSSISILMALGFNHLKWNHPKLTFLIRNSCSTVLLWRPPSRFRSLFVTISGFRAACLSSRVFFFFAGDSDVLYDWFSEIVQ